MSHDEHILQQTSDLDHHQQSTSKGHQYTLDTVTESLLKVINVFMGSHRRIPIDNVAESLAILSFLAGGL